MENIHERLKLSFGEVSEMYDQVRPDYPERTIEDVIEMSNIQPNGHILELGCGSGKATLPFAEKGFNITALDISQSLVDVAKKNLADFKNVNFVTNSFENADLPPNSYDLITSAQAFHWLKPDIRYKKAHTILTENGHLALFSNFQEYGSSELEEAVYELYQKHCPNYPAEYGSLDKFKTDLLESKLFKNIRQETYHRHIPYSKQDYIKLQNSFSWVSTLDQEKSAKFFWL